MTLEEKLKLHNEFILNEKIVDADKYPIDKSKFVDYTDTKFNKLTAKSFVGIDKGHHKYWLFECECGNKIIAELSNVKSGRTTSCGCEASIKSKERATTHGLYGTKLYGIYHAMLNRCTRKNDKSYYRYGGRGIKVCDEWLDAKIGFPKFYNWATENGYRDGLTIDRINNDGPYSPENCRWVDAKTQSNNTRRTRYITYRGYTFSLGWWSEITSIPVKILEDRIYRHWNPEQILRIPLGYSRWDNAYLTWEVPPRMMEHHRPDKVNSDIY